MSSLEKEYLDNVERAKAHDRKRELVISGLTAGFGMPISEVAIEQGMDGRVRTAVRVALGTIFIVGAFVIVAFGSGSPKDREHAYIDLFVFAFAGLITLWKFVYGRFRRWNNARLERRWERVLGLNANDRP